jgi:hypothetical protein
MMDTFAGILAASMDAANVPLPVALAAAGDGATFAGVEPLLEVEPVPGREAAAGKGVSDGSLLAGGNGKQQQEKVREELPCGYLGVQGVQQTPLLENRQEHQEHLRLSLRHTVEGCDHLQQR